MRLFSNLSKSNLLKVENNSKSLTLHPIFQTGVMYNILYKKYFVSADYIMIFNQNGTGFDIFTAS